MAAMMLPSHAPLLWGYRQSLRATGEAASRTSHPPCKSRVFRRLDLFWIGRVFAWRGVGNDGDASTGTGACCSGSRRFNHLLPVQSSSLRGKHITWRVAGKRPGEAAHCRVMRGVPGDRVCALDFIAASAVRI